MNRKEISKIILILKTAYPHAFREMSQQEVETMVDLYQEVFKENTYQEVAFAVMKIIKTNEYMPTMATIKNAIYETKFQDESNTELWERLLKAIRNSNYHAEEEFNMLPEVVKEYIKSPLQLQELALMPSNDIHTVVKGQFLKQIELIKQKFKEDKITNKEIEGTMFQKLEEFK